MSKVEHAPSLTIRMHPPAAPENLYVTTLSTSLASEGHEVRGRGPTDLLHYHWLQAPFDAPTRSEAFKGATRYLGDLWSARRQGAATVWTVHNLDAHEGHWRGEAAFMYSASRLLDGWISLSEHAATLAVARWPTLRSLPHVVTSHGDLTVSLPEPTEQPVARQELGLDNRPTIVFAGTARPYKGVADLVEATEGLRGRGIHLVVAGDIRDPALAQTSRQRGLTVVDRRLDDADFVRYVSAADLVVLPFRHVTHSGSLLTVAALGGRVLAPASGAIPEQVAGLEDAVRLYEPPLDATAVQRALKWAMHEDPPDRGLIRTRLGAWDEIARQTAHLYRRAIDHRHPNAHKNPGSLAWP